MSSWRMDLAVLTDLSASMFVACFMILLIFLSLVQAEAPAPEGERAPVEAMASFHVVRRGVPSSAAMVDLLHAHAHAEEGASVDLFTDRAVVRVPGRAEPVTVSAAEGFSGLAQALAAAPPGALRLFVFSNEAYLPAAALLAGTGRGWSELSVPQALRDPQRPELDWSAAFHALEAASGDARQFRAGLAAILDATETAGAKRGGGAPMSSAPAPSGQAAASLIQRIRDTLSWLRALSVPTIALLAVLTIERRRFRPIRGWVPAEPVGEQHS